MRTLGALLIAVLASFALGCGGGGETATSTDTGSADRVVSKATQDETAPERTAGKSARPRLQGDYPVPDLPPQRRPLERLVVKDLEIGRGPAAHWGDEATVRYVGVYWKTGEIYSQHWDYTLDFELDGEWFGPGWQRGIQGMRVGGRRELRIPAALVFNRETDAAYVVSLVDVKSGAAR